MPKHTMTTVSRNFDDFLYSVIREEAGGGSLTMLSLLARHNVDPWEAAQGLARLPRQAAAAELRRLIAAVDHEELMPHDDEAFAVALVARLPRKSMVGWSATTLLRKVTSATRTRTNGLLDRLGRIWSGPDRRSQSDKNEEDP
jgi:hypothetical protein